MEYKSRLFIDINNHIMLDEKPSIYLNQLLATNRLQEHPFTMLSDLVKADQNKKYHPEGNVWNHTLMVVDEAAKRKASSENPRVFMWAALLHDIGKPPTTKRKNGRLVSYNHEKEGKKMAEEFLRIFGMEEEFISKVSHLVRWHMEPLFLAKNSPSSNTEQMLREISLEELALLATCDRLGRGDMTGKKAEDEKRGIEIFLSKCRKLQERMMHPGSK